MGPSSSTLPSVVVVLLFHLVYLILPLSAVCVPIYLILWTSQWAVATTWIAVYISWFALTYHSEIDGQGRPWMAYENLWLWRRLFEWFPMKIVKPDKPLEASEQYLFCVHPHGVLAFNRGMFGISTRTLWDTAFPGISFRVLTATAAFRIPVIREFWLWSYCIDARKAVAVRALSRGTSLLLYPGGEKEQIMTERGKQRVFIKSRKGFCKLALQHGCSLVPMYVFGETDLYNHWKLGLGIRKWIVNKFGAAIMVISGSFGLLPFRVPLTAVSGPPIAVTRVENPNQKQIDDLHATYVRALIELFDSQKKAHGYDQATLEIY